MEKQNVIPELRFSEFLENWNEKRLGEIAEIKSGGTPKRGKAEYWNGDIPWVTTSLLNSDEIWTTDEFITKDGLDNSSAKLFPINTILMAMYGQGKTRGMVSNLKIEASTNQACAALILNNSVNNEFVFQSLKNEYDTLRKLSNDGGQKNLSSGLIRNFKFVIPNSLPEQTKIATFLTAVDKRINLLQKKRTELEQYKKGVMQKLFSQSLRFKPALSGVEGNDDGSDFEDWEEKKLGEVCVKKSSNISANTLKDNFGEYKIYGASGYLKSIDFYREEEPYISIVKDGAGVGRTLLCEAKSSVLGTLDTIKAKDGNNLNFLYSLINQIHFTKYITGSTIPHIYFRDYSKEKVIIPKPKEQQKIANFLSSIDKSIENIANQIDDSVLFKKGLLQKMFV